MIIEEALLYHLEHDAGVLALVGSRVYPLIIPQDVDLPAIAYQRIDGPRVRSQSGPSHLAHPRIQITCQASMYSSAKALAGAVRASLDGYRGLMGGAGGVQVYGCFVENDIDELIQVTNSPAIRIDAIIWHEEA